jgi:hypothetical protein
VAVRQERIGIGDAAKKRNNHFSMRVQKMLYKGASLEYYGVWGNSREMRIQVETKGFSRDKMTGDMITIG